MKKVAVWGKFDILHKGHLEFLKNAKALGDELYIIVIPDKAVSENTYKTPDRTAKERQAKLKELDFIKEVYIDSLECGLSSILQLCPDIFAFGHDQKTVWEEKLQKYLSSKNLYPQYVRLGLYNKGIHASQLKSK